MDKKTSGAKSDLLILAAGNSVQYLAAILTLKLSTSILSPAEMGRMSIILAVIMWFNVLLSGVGSYVQRNLLVWNEGRTARKYILNFAKYLLLISVFGSIAIAGIQKTIGIGIDITALWVLLLIFGYLFFSHLNGSFVGLLNLFKQRFWFMLFSNITIVAGLGLSVLFCLGMGKSAEYWLLGQILGQATILYFSGTLFFKLLNAPSEDGTAAPEVKTESLSGIFAFVWPMSAAALLLWFQQSSYRFLMEKISGVEVVGLFTVGFGLGINFMNRFEILFNQFYHPIFFKEIVADDVGKRTAAWNNYAYYLMPTSLVLALYVVFGGPFIAKIFVGEQFYDIAKSVIVWGVISQLILIFMTIYSMAGIIQQQTRKFIIPNIIGVVVMLGALIGFSRLNPFLSAGLSLSAGSLASLLAMRVKMKKLLPIHFPLKRVFFSVLISLPMIGVLFAAGRMFVNPGIILSLAVLTVSGVYMAFIQFVLVKDRLKLPESLAIFDRLERRFENLLFKQGNASGK